MKETLKSLGITRETIKRAARTFIQAIIAYLAVNLAVVDFTAEKQVIKSALIGLAVSALSAGISAVMNLQKPEQLGAGKNTLSFSEWVNRYKGRKTDYDGAYGVQCVDLIDCYTDRCLGLRKGFWGNAKYWWLSRKESKWLKDNFTFITPKYKNGELKKGDIGIRTSGTYGHIFVVAEPASNGKFKYYDQNASGNGDKMTLRSKPYTKDYINGVLRPKDRESLVSPPKIKSGTYTLTNARGVYKGAGAKTGRKKVKDLTVNARLHTTSKKSSADAYLKANTKVTILETKLISSGNLWARIPSGWICVWEKNIDKKFVK